MAAASDVNPGAGSVFADGLPTGMVGSGTGWTGMEGRISIDEAVVADLVRIRGDLVRLRGERGARPHAEVDVGPHFFAGRIRFILGALAQAGLRGKSEHMMRKHAGLPRNQGDAFDEALELLRCEGLVVGSGARLRLARPGDDLPVPRKALEAVRARPWPSVHDLIEAALDATWPEPISKDGLLRLAVAGGFTKNQAGIALNSARLRNLPRRTDRPGMWFTGADGHERAEGGVRDHRGATPAESGRTHDLDCGQEAYDAMVQGRLHHDVRPEPEGGIRVSDRVRYRDPRAAPGEAGRGVVEADVTYVTSAGNPCALSPDGLSPGYCILSLSVSGMSSEPHGAADHGSPSMGR